MEITHKTKDEATRVSPTPEAEKTLEKEVSPTESQRMNEVSSTIIKLLINF